MCSLLLLNNGLETCRILAIAPDLRGLERQNPIPAVSGIGTADGCHGLSIPCGVRWASRSGPVPFGPRYRWGRTPCFNRTPARIPLGEFASTLKLPLGVRLSLRGTVVRLPDASLRTYASVHIAGGRRNVRVCVFCDIDLERQKRTVPAHPHRISNAMPLSRLRIH